MSAAGAALLFSALAQYATAADTELASETVCWVVLPAAVELWRRRRSNGATSPTLFSRASSAATSTRGWLFALAVAAACLYRAEENVVTLFPALTPLLLLSGVRPAASVLADSKLFWPPVNERWSSGLIAAFSCLALVASNGVGLLALAACVVVVALLYGGYFAISRTSSYIQVDEEDLGDEQEHDNVAEGVGAQDMALPLALCILPLLAVAIGVRIFILHKTNDPIIASVLAGLLKALGWFFTLEATRYSSWCIASTIGTFAIASTGDHSLEDHWSYMQAVSYFLASLASLTQTIHMVPRDTKLRLALWALSILPLIPLIATMYGSSATPHPPDTYPVEALARAAEARFEAMLGRQSRNFTAAASEYRRRYGLEPPPGFEAWYDYAVAHDSPIIDEFDMIYEDLAPFLKLSGLAVREAVKEAGERRSADLWKCEFKAETRETHCKHPFRPGEHLQEAFGKWLGDMAGDMAGQLPDMDFLVNDLDEPRVMLPAENSTIEEQTKVIDMSRGPVWEAVVRNCPRQPRAAGAEEQGVGEDINTHGMPFVTDTRVDKDLCRHPEYREMHGLVMSPTTFVLLDGAVPVLSTAALSTMGDVMFPNVGYGKVKFAYDQEGDMEWDKKSNNLYWAGSTTGGWASDDGWKKFHRHRFVALAQGLGEKTEHWYLREKHGSLQRVASPDINSDLFDVAFTAVIQCSSKMCDSQNAFFDVQPRADKDAAFASKLVFDLDGNGLSGRFVKLLASRSAVLKQTLLREWHDERLAAWVHYLPVSQGLGELPELVAWLTGTDDGQSRAKAVADRGREWAAKALRAEDREVYVYRLMLELVRVMDPKREAM